MKISIIIPVYNSAQYLEECLESVISQDFEDWECLLVNDGSTDNSGHICDLYTNRDYRFKVFHVINSGVSFARNLGIKYASGTYIVFIDSDDTVDRTYLSTLYQATLLSASELIVCGIRYVRSLGIQTKKLPEDLITIGKTNADRFVELNRKFLLYGPVNKLYHSSIIKNNRICFPVGVHYGEDLIFNFKYLEHITHIRTIASAGYNYRILGEGSLSTSVYSRDFETNYKQWKVICIFFQQKEITTKTAHTYLSNRLWGIAYDTVMSNQLSIKKIKTAFDGEFINNLRLFNAYTIPVPQWLKTMIMNRWHGLMWLIQHKNKMI
ncbi:glycosyltransferase family 2 protein [Bacteroides sp. 519]|uniref:glycosyltransferase family 2 protein n=1 Tax=Bacteroides sp. 519 TaxID=2302937 RepID=UPI0013D65F42|nr:glycosyltransferase family 2 protein [Bacteroides sp. 519]NDV60229.1 glycosyltransferase family 2 protein [Bacteroides sp. 519]